MLRFLLTVQAVELGAVTLAGLVGLLHQRLTGFVETHIWSPAYTYYLLLLLVVLDVLTNNLLTGTRLRPRRLALRLVAYTLVMGFAHGFSEHEKGLFFLSQLTVAPFVIIHLRRLIISLGKLELVDGDVAELLSKRITRAAEEAPVPAAEPAVVPVLEAAPLSEPVTADAEC